MKTIAILGTSFCGSTLLNLILGGLPGVLGAGETHWLQDAKPGSGLDLCKECGDACPVLTREVAAEVRANPPRMILTTLSKTTGFDAVVCTDKYYAQHEDGSGLTHAIVLYKDPRAAVSSFLYHWAARDGRPARNLQDIKASPEDIETAVAKWSSIYIDTVKWLEQRPRIKSISAKLEDLTAAPVDEMERICSFLGLTFDPSVVDFAEKEQHHLGGNFTIRGHHNPGSLKNADAGHGNEYRQDWAARFGRRVGIDDRWKQVLADEQAEAIMNYPAVTMAMEALNAL